MQEGFEGEIIMVLPSEESPPLPFETRALIEFGEAIDNINAMPKDWEIGMFEPVIDQLSFRVDLPVIWAKVLMSNLGNAEEFSAEEKAFWLKVGEELGPDWIAKFRRIGAFMALVERA